MVIWSNPAKRNLKDIYLFIAKDSKYYAVKVRDQIVQQGKKLELFPNIGRIVPEIQNPKTREVFIYSYRLIYRISKDADISF